jgi:hypothetical protein
MKEYLVEVLHEVRNIKGNRSNDYDLPSWVIYIYSFNNTFMTAVDNDSILDKEATSYNDIFDAFRLALKFYHFEEVS